MDTSTTSTSPSPLAIILVRGGILLALLLLFFWRSQPDGKLHVFFFPVAGDAILIQAPDGRAILIDGGSDPTKLPSALGRQLPFWRRSLDVAILTRPDHAHLPGQIAALERYPATLVLAPPIHHRDLILDEWGKLIAQNQSHLRMMRKGERLIFGSIVLHVLTVGDTKQSGVILRLDYGSTSVVFGHSGTPADEQALLDQGLPSATLLSFPWERDPQIPFVFALHPQAIVFTDGYQDRNPAKLSFFRRAIGGARLFHEQIDGMIEWQSNGQTSQILTER